MAYRIACGAVAIGDLIIAIAVLNGYVPNKFALFFVYLTVALLLGINALRGAD